MRFPNRIFPASRRGDQRGAAAVELALVLPMLVMLVFGIIEFGRAYNAKIALTAATREGVRALVLGADADEVESTVTDAAPSLDPAKVTINPPVIAPCPVGQPAAVRATYDIAWNIPLFGSGTWTIEGRGVMRCGG